MKFFFIFLFLQINYISKIFSQTCGKAKPQSKEECLSDSSTNSYCCHLKTKLSNDTDSQCIFVPKSQIFITPHLKSIRIGKDDDTEIIEINIDCGFDPGNLSQGQPYSYCNKTSAPVDPYECINNSYINATCCYIRNPNNSSYCVLNNGIYKDNNTFFGVEIICKGNYINFRYSIIFFLLITIFIV